MNCDEGGHGPQLVRASEDPDSIEARILPSPDALDTTAQFFEALYLLASLIVALPAYLAMSIALALAFYIRCAGLLLGVMD